MASKRGLYKPAIQEGVVQKEKRKALTQGRLVTKPSITNVPAESVNTSSAAGQRTIVGSSEGSAGYSLSVRRQLASAANISSSTLSATGLPTDTNTTPRKKSPRVSQDKSPKQAKPSHSLDLSDTEDENRNSASMSEVLVVDASRPLKTLDDTEVDVALHFSESPAKVICHAAGRVVNPAVFRGSGNVGEAAKVTVDKLASICIGEPNIRGQGGGGGVGKGRKEDAVMEEEEVENEEETVPTELLARRPLVVRESGMPAAALPHFRALMAMTSTGIDHHGPALVDADTTSSDGSRCETDQSLTSSRAAVATMVEKTSNEMVQVNRGPAKAKAVNLAIDDDISTKLKAKRKAPKIISSRYMQPTKGPMKGDRSVLPEGYMTKMSTFVGTASGSGGGADSSRTKQRQGSGGGISSSNSSKLKRSTSDTKMKLPPASLSITPDPRPCFGGHSSTPTAAEASLFTPPAGADISAIGPVPILDVTAATDKSFRHKSRSLSRTRDSERSGGTGTAADCLIRMIRPNGGEITQWDLELLYGIVAQCAFLESKARKCLREQEKQAASQIYGLWELVEKSRCEKAELEQQLAKLRHIRCLDDAIELQNSGLNTIAGRLPQVGSEYRQLAAAIDTTRHHMPTKGIYLPLDRKDEYFDELSRALAEQEHLLGEISVMTRKQVPAVDECAKLLSSTEAIVERETNCISRCQVVLSSVCSMLTQESALQLQHMFASDVNRHLVAKS